MVSVGQAGEYIYKTRESSVWKDDNINEWGEYVELHMETRSSSSSSSKNVAHKNSLRFFLYQFFHALHTPIDCVLPLELDYSVNLPLIFTSNGTLISRDTPSSPDEEEISVILPKNVEILLSCVPNYFRNYPSEKTLIAKCGKDNTFREFWTFNLLANFNENLSFSHFVQLSATRRKTFCQNFYATLVPSMR